MSKVFLINAPTTWSYIRSIHFKFNMVIKMKKIGKKVAVPYERLLKKLLAPYPDS